MTVTLITGANRGLGLGFVRQSLLRSKYTKVIATARSRSEHDELSQLESRYQGRLKNVTIEDMGDLDHVQSGVTEIENIARDGVDIVINNALHLYQPYRTPGNTGITSLPLLSWEGVLDYKKSFHVNTLGPLALSVALFERGLIRTKSADDEGGMMPKIVNIGSAQQSISHASEIWSGGSDRNEAYFHPIYAATKVALSGVTIHLARELRGKVLVNSLHPGRVATESGRIGVTRTADEAASASLDIIESWRSPADSGQFVDWRGRTVPW